jgi:hypothetical protein
MTKLFVHETLRAVVPPQMLQAHAKLRQRLATPECARPHIAVVEQLPLITQRDAKE